MKRKATLLSVMVGALLVAVAGVAWAATIQCDGEGDRDPDPGQCAGTNSGDVITGTTNADIIKARGSGEQVDQVMALRGTDKVLGGDGADQLYGGGSSDTLNAGPNLTTPLEADFLSGGAGNDTLVESRSQDRYGFEPGWGKDTITGDGDQPDVQPDSDGLCFACGPIVTTDLTINLATGRAFETAAGRTGPNTVTWDTTNGPFIENATGGSGADTIRGSTRSNIVDGFNGGDTINVADGGGFDLVDCGGGFSTGDGAADTVTMDAGADFATSSCTGDPNDQVNTVP
jgi:Ca2+-binding RTX toxin-like protein